MRTNNKGFTLIGLMTALTIIGILSVMSIAPAKFQTIKHQVNSVHDSLGIIKYTSANYFFKNNEWPINGDILLYGHEDRFVDEIFLDEDGAITIWLGKYSNKELHDKHFTLIPSVDKYNQVVWDCLTDIKKPYTPILCKYDDSDH